jgi:hypothetical protein
MQRGSVDSNKAWDVGCHQRDEVNSLPQATQACYSDHAGRFRKKDLFLFLNFRSFKVSIRIKMVSITLQSDNSATLEEAVLFYTRQLGFQQVLRRGNESNIALFGQVVLHLFADPEEPAGFTLRLQYSNPKEDSNDVDVDIQARLKCITDRLAGTKVDDLKFSFSASNLDVFTPKLTKGN